MLTDKQIIRKMRDTMEELGSDGNIGITTTLLFNIAKQALIERCAELAEHPKYTTVQAGMAGTFIAEDLRKGLI